VVKERVMASLDRPPPITWKQHPIFAPVFARLGPTVRQVRRGRRRLDVRDLRVGHPQHDPGHLHVGSDRHCALRCAGYGQADVHCTCV
jgi:hypothetical protein